MQPPPRSRLNDILFRDSVSPGAEPHIASKTWPTMDEELPAEVVRRHAAALDAGEEGYLDPATGLYVFTSESLRERGECCDSGCRHCPFG